MTSLKDLSKLSPGVNCQLQMDNIKINFLEFVRSLSVVCQGSLNGLPRWPLQKCSPNELSKLSPVVNSHLQTPPNRLSKFFESVRGLSGVCQDSVRILPRFCQDSVRSLSGFCQELVRSLSGVGQKSARSLYLGISCTCYNEITMINETW